MSSPWHAATCCESPAVGKKKKKAEKGKGVHNTTSVGVGLASCQSHIYAVQTADAHAQRRVGVQGWLPKRRAIGNRQLVRGERSFLLNRRTARMIGKGGGRGGGSEVW